MRNTKLIERLAKLLNENFDGCELSEIFALIRKADSNERGHEHPYINALIEKTTCCNCANEIEERDKQQSNYFRR